MVTRVVTIFQALWKTLTNILPAIFDISCLEYEIEGYGAAHTHNYVLEGKYKKKLNKNSEGLGHEVEVQTNL